MITVADKTTPSDKTVKMSILPGAGNVTVVERVKPEPAPPEPEKPDDKPPVEAEIEQRRQEMLISMGYAKPGDFPAVEPAKPAAPAPAAAKPEATPAPEATPEPSEAPTVSQDERDERLIRRTVEAVTKKPDEETTPEPAKDIAADLTPADRKDFKVFQQMEAMYPETKGKADEFAAWAKKRYEYEAQWKKDNKGKDFDPEDSEHEEFYATQPEFAEDQFKDAEIEMRVSEQLERRLADNPTLKAAEERAKAQETQVIMQKAAPVIAEQVGRNIVDMVKAVNPELSKMLLNENGGIDLGKANQDRLAEADPIFAEVLYPIVTDELAPMLFELEKTTVKGLNFVLRPDQNQVHAAISRFADEYERDVMAAPEDVRTRADGSKFITIAGKQKLVDEAEAIKDKVKREKRLGEIAKDYFTVTVDDLESYIVDALASKAQKIYKKLDSTAAKKYGKAAPAAAPAPSTDNLPPSERPAPTTVTHRPPSLSSQPDLVTVGPGGKGPEKNFGQTMTETHYRK